MEVGSLQLAVGSLQLAVGSLLGAKRRLCRRLSAIYRRFRPNTTGLPSILNATDGKPVPIVVGVSADIRALGSQVAAPSQRSI